jgi:uncharacterized protein (DUF488 family)
VVIFTIGHSTHTADAFVGLLLRHQAEQVADVRTLPRSRRHPHFGAEALAALLDRHGIGYRHFPALGGLRRPRADSVHTAWKHPAFRGYADHMDTEGFAAGIVELSGFARTAATAVMCAEALWWQCHRRLLADALTAQGVTVDHILAAGSTQPHEITPFASISEGRVSYPGLL